MIQTSINGLKTKPCVDVPILDVTVDVPPRNEDVAIGEVPDTTTSSDNPPLKKSLRAENFVYISILINIPTCGC